MTIRLLLNLKCTAEEYKFPEKLADAYWFIGECLLKQQQSNLAKLVLGRSFTLSKKLRNIKNMEKIRFL